MFPEIYHCKMTDNYTFPEELEKNTFLFIQSVLESSETKDSWENVFSEAHYIGL